MCCSDTAEPMPLTDEGYPICKFKTVGADANLYFLARKTSADRCLPALELCRLYPFRGALVSVERGF